MSFSQNAEESFILTYFGDRVECFLDIGAALTFSNTRQLATNRWGGVCVDADPVAAEELRRFYADNPSVAVVEAAIGTDGDVLLHATDGALVSTTVESHMRKWASAATFHAITVKGISSATLLSEHPGPFAFFNLDVEGANAELFEMFPLTDMGVELVCVEHDCEDKRILEHCAKHGLHRTLYRCPENLIVGK